MKFYALEQDGKVILASVREEESLPIGSVELNKEAYLNGRLIRNPMFRKIVGSEVLEKTADEKNTALNSVVGSKKAVAQYRIGRKTFRMVRLPFDYNGTRIKLEEGDLRSTPYGIFSTWDNYIRDAVLCEMHGHSILPIRVMNENDEDVLIDTQEKLYNLHAAMTQANKVSMEEEVTLRNQLRTTETYQEVKDVRTINTSRERE